MKTKELLKISLRQNALFIPKELMTNDVQTLSGTTSVLLANVSKLGFTFSEGLLRRVGISKARVFVNGQNIKRYPKNETGRR